MRHSSESIHVEPYSLFRQFSMLFGALPIDLIVAEDYMSPAAQRNERAIISQLIVHGALDVYAGHRRVPVTRISVNDVRREVCGRSTAEAPPGVTWTKDQRRRATKQMVIERMQELGLADRSLCDDNQADALATWKWAEVVKGGAPRVFALT